MWLWGEGGRGVDPGEFDIFLTEARVKFPTPGHLVNTKFLPLDTFSLPFSHPGICWTRCQNPYFSGASQSQISMGCLFSLLWCLTLILQKSPNHGRDSNFHITALPTFVAGMLRSDSNQPEALVVTESPPFSDNEVFDNFLL